MPNFKKDWQVVLENAIFNPVSEVVSLSMENEAGIILRKAKKLAPVRKVFKQFGERRNPRTLTGGQLYQERGARKALFGGQPDYMPRYQRRLLTQSTLDGAIGQGREVVIRTRSGDVEVSRNEVGRIEMVGGKPREVGHKFSSRNIGFGLRNVAFEEALTSHGGYELRSGRAVYKRKDESATLGGRLRSEIYATDVLISSRGKHVVSVVSPTYYAKYVEYGTRHAAAQPFLRPAFAASKLAYRGKLVTALKRLGKR